MNDRKRILLVDDDEMILSCFERILGRRFTLDAAVGPAEALRAIEARGPYAVVVTDMRMPGMNGVELLTHAKQAAPQTIGVLISGNGQLDEFDHAVRDGVIFKVLEKPCRVGELIEVLDEALLLHGNAVAV